MRVYGKACKIMQTMQKYEKVCQNLRKCGKKIETALESIFYTKKVLKTVPINEKVRPKLKKYAKT